MTHNQSRYTTKRMHDEIEKAKAYARCQALTEAAAIAEGKAKAFDLQKALADCDDQNVGAVTARIEIARQIRALIDGTTPPPPPSHVVGIDGLDEQAFDAARVAFHRTAVGDYGTLRAAISAYLACMPHTAGRHALELAEGRLSLLLEAYPDNSDKIDHPVATRYVLEQVSAALATATPETKP